MRSDYQPRRLTVIDLLTEAIRLYRAHAVTLLVIVAVVLVPITLVEFFIQQRFVAPALDTLATIGRNLSASPAPALPTDALNEQIYALIVFPIMLVILQSLIAANLTTCALITAIADIRSSRPAQLLNVYRRSMRPFLALAMASLLVLVIIAIPAVLLLLCSALAGSTLLVSTNGQNRVLVGIGLAFAIIVVLLLFGGALVFFGVRYQLIPQTVVLERIGPIAGMRRSWRLVKGSFGYTLVVIIVLGIISYLIELIPAGLVVIGTIMIAGNAAEMLSTTQVVFTVISSIRYILWLPLQVITFSLLYDQLLREGDSVIIRQAL